MLTAQSGTPEDGLSPDNLDGKRAVGFASWLPRANGRSAKRWCRIDRSDQG